MSTCIVTKPKSFSSLLLMYMSSMIHENLDKSRSELLLPLKFEALGLTKFNFPCGYVLLLLGDTNVPKLFSESGTDLHMSSTHSQEWH